MTVCFSHTFSFAEANPDNHNALQIIWDVVLKFVSVAYPVDPHAHCHMQSMMECYNISRKSKDDDELQNINILETEGSRDVAASEVSTNPMTQPLNIKKFNIGTKENPKFTSVGDYWDEETMANIADILHEFQDLFPKILRDERDIG